MAAREGRVLFCARSVGRSVLKKDLVAKLQEGHPDLRPIDAEKIVDTVLDEISDALKDGRRVELRGFGAFSVRKRDPRKARNPRTGEPVNVEEKHVPFFKAGKELRMRVNDGDDPEAGKS